MKYIIKGTDEGKKFAYEVESDVTLHAGDRVFLIPDGTFFLTDEVKDNVFFAMRVTGDEVDIYTYRELK